MKEFASPNVSMGNLFMSLVKSNPLTEENLFDQHGSVKSSMNVAPAKSMRELSMGADLSLEAL